MNNFEEFKQQLIERICKLDSEEATESFLNSILTDREMEDIVHRLQIFRLLKEGISQREIVSRLGVGIATVTRGSKVLKKGNFNEL